MDNISVVNFEPIQYPHKPLKWKLFARLVSILVRSFSMILLYTVGYLKTVYHKKQPHLLKHSRIDIFCSHMIELLNSPVSRVLDSDYDTLSRIVIDFGNDYGLYAKLVSGPSLILTVMTTITTVYDDYPEIRLSPNQLISSYSRQTYSL